MDRRTFLRTLTAGAGALSAGGLLTACARDSAGPAIPQGQPQLSIATGSFEMLAGDDRPVTFGLFDAEQALMRDADVDVWLRDLEQNIIAGPVPAEYTEAGGPGLYVAMLDLPEGRSELVAASGGEHGVKVLEVRTPETSALLAPGDDAPAAPTPTVEDDLGVAAVCTQDPPCGMHEMSLDDALEQQRPIVLLFATPLYCQTAVCGPAVSTVDKVREDWRSGDPVWIHAEIYRDAGTTLTEAVQEWQLPSEPWLYTISADGTIAGRLDGPMLPGAVEDLVSGIV